MKALHKIWLVTGIIALSSAPLWAQQLKGIATYKTSQSIQISMDSTKMSPEAMAQMKQQLQQQMQKDFELAFDNKSSAWKEIESLGGAPAAASAGGARIVMMGGGSALLYKDIQEGRLERTADMMGKQFLIKDELPQYNWQLTDESKQIGQYTCHKAIYSRVVDARKFSAGMKEMEATKDTLRVEAWFTPAIPVSHGPENYWGLPGLILELKAGGVTMVCSKIVLNPKEEVVIERPKKGKEVTQAEFQAVQEEKMQEMMNRYRENAGGDRIQLRIGG